MVKYFLNFLIVFITIESVFAQTKQDDLQYCIVTNQYNKAHTICSQLIRQNPDNADLYYQKAIICKQLYKYPEATENIEKAL